MTYARFTDMLSHYLARFQEAAHLLAEAQRLARPTDELTATLHQELQAYSWAVQSRMLLRPAAAATPPQQALELHLRLSVVETLVGLRCGQLPGVAPAARPEEVAPTPQQLQRLATAEARVFHLYQVAPLN